MKRLWAPWRMKFVETHEPAKGCVFCSILAQSDDAANLLIFRGKSAFVILNRYPYTSGHLLIVSNKHCPSLENLDPETRAEMMELANYGVEVLRNVYAPEGFNVGANIGSIAGAGIAEHIHLHVVPRWSGDTNFMSTLSETRVLPESLDETYLRVFSAWNHK